MGHGRTTLQGTIFRVKKIQAKLPAFVSLLVTLERGVEWIQMLCYLIVLKVTFFYMEKKKTEMKLRVAGRVYANQQYACCPPQFQVKGLKRSSVNANICCDSSWHLQNHFGLNDYFEIPLIGTTAKFKTEVCYDIY